MKFILFCTIIILLLIATFKVKLQGTFIPKTDIRINSKNGGWKTLWNRQSTFQGVKNNEGISRAFTTEEPDISEIGITSKDATEKLYVLQLKGGYTVLNSNKNYLIVKRCVGICKDNKKLNMPLYFTNVQIGKYNTLTNQYSNIKTLKLVGACGCLQLGTQYTYELEKRYYLPYGQVVDVGIKANIGNEETIKMDEFRNEINPNINVENYAQNMPKLLFGNTNVDQLNYENIQINANVLE